MSKDQSFRVAAWRRLRKNRGAVFSLIIIGLACLVAIFAYFISPDPSPYANRIILEIGGNKPGFCQQFIKIKKEKNISDVSWITHLIAGKEDRYYYIPVTSHEQIGDSIIVQKYIDEGVSERSAYHVSQAAPEPIVTKKFVL